MTHLQVKHTKQETVVMDKLDPEKIRVVYNHIKHLHYDTETDKIILSDALSLLNYIMIKANENDNFTVNVAIYKRP